MSRKEQLCDLYALIVAAFNKCCELEEAFSAEDDERNDGFASDELSDLREVSCELQSAKESIAVRAGILIH